MSGVAYDVSVEPFNTENGMNLLGPAINAVAQGEVVNMSLPSAQVHISVSVNILKLHIGTFLIMKPQCVFGIVTMKQYKISL